MNEKETALYSLSSNIAHDRPSNTTESLEDKFIEDYRVEDTVDYITKLRSKINY